MCTCYRYCWCGRGNLNKMKKCLISKRIFSIFIIIIVWSCEDKNEEIVDAILFEKQTCFENLSITSPYDCLNSTNYYAFSWDDECEAIDLWYGSTSSLGLHVDLTEYEYTTGFFFYGFGPNETRYFQLGSSDGALTSIISATTSSEDCD